MKHFPAYLAALAIALQFILFGLNIPCEDAHILMRVSENIVNGNGPVYSAGQTEDVATELLQAYAVAGLWYVGWPRESAHIALGVLAMVLILLAAVRRGASWGVYVGIALTPLAYWTGAGLGTPIYAALVVLLVIYARSRHVWIVGVLGTLARPEFALLFAVVMLYVNRRRMFMYVWPAVVVMIIRMAYYGGPPLSAIVKHGDLMNGGAVYAAVVWVVIAGAVILCMSRRWWPVLILAVFPLVYLLSDNSMNIALRLQLAYLPALLIAARDVRPRVAVIGLVTLAFTVAGPVQPDERIDVGLMLRGAGGRMLTTEAGWLPYYSRWESSDALGLTDAHIANYGLDTAYLDRRQYDLIMWHCYNGTRELIQRYESGERIAPDEWRGTDHWNGVVSRLADYAQSRGYILVAVANVSYDARWYLIRPSLSPAAQMQLAAAISRPAECYPYRMTTEVE